MGGFGSGRWARSEAKARTVDHKFVDVRWLARIKALEAGTEVRFDNGESLKVISAGLSLEVLFFTDNYNQTGLASVRFRPCALGGQRSTFVCPNCYKPVYVLYRHRCGYKCRKCAKLAYKSQSEDRITRSLTRVNRLLRKIDPTACLMTGVPEKPSGMHNSTYRRLVQSARTQLDEVVPQWGASIAKHSELIGAVVSALDDLVYTNVDLDRLS